jgi:general secretion pathway protein H
MPTSATGTSSKTAFRSRSRSTAARDLGFTLLEVLVVMVIIGIITTMAVVSTRVLGGDHEMAQEAKRLQAVITQVREEAMLEGRDIGLRMDAVGYEFLAYDVRRDLWVQVIDDPMLRERSLPPGLEATLLLESREVKLTPRSAGTEKTPLTPQVVVQASGDLVPFEIRFAREGTDTRMSLVGKPEGTVSVIDASDSYAR